MWVNGVPFGEKRPAVPMDVAFYAFDLPWYRFLLGFGFAAAVLSLIAAALTHYLYGGLRVTSPVPAPPRRPPGTCPCCSASSSR